MATPANGTETAGDPASVGTAFIDQYYNVLQQFPHLAHRFYTDISELSRSEPDGQMTSVTTMQGINDKILSMGYEKYHLQILSAYAQASYKGGFFVLVTGCLTGKDDKKRTFSQSFFLTFQDNGFFVLNDIFRYVNGELVTTVSIAEEGIDVKAIEVPVPDPETTEAPEPEVDHHEVDVQIVGNAEELAIAKENISESYSNLCQEDNQVSSLKQNNAPFQVRVLFVKPQVQPRTVTTPEASFTPNGNIPSEKSEISAVTYPRMPHPPNLKPPSRSLDPSYETASKSEAGSCYGFVDFESESAMCSAHQEASILIGNHSAHIEEQKKDGIDRGRP